MSAGAPREANDADNETPSRSCGGRSAPRARHRERRGQQLLERGVVRLVRVVELAQVVLERGTGGGDVDAGQLRRVAQSRLRRLDAGLALGALFFGVTSSRSTHEAASRCRSLRIDASLRSRWAASGT